MKTAPIDLGFVVEVDLHIRKWSFGKEDVVLLHEALETISKLPNSMDYRGREMVVEYPALHF